MEIGTLERTRSSVDEPVEQAWLGPVGRQLGLQERPRSAVVRGASLAAASAVWMSLTFALCYVLLPVAADLSGAHPGLLASLWADVLGFGAMLAAVTLGVLVGRPEVRVDRQPATAPIAAATVASLAVWAVLHSLLPGLVRFEDMGVVGFSSFLAMNIVESSLFGVMLASLVRTVPRAFVAGGAFQAAFFGITWVIWIAVTGLLG